MNYYDKIKGMYAKEKYKFFEGLYSVNIFGVRDENPINDGFGCTLGMAVKTYNGFVCFGFPATTLPAKKFLLNPSNEDGCAILKEGQYRGAYKLGKHKGRPALVQRGAPVTVFRDHNRDDVYDFGGREETGYFGINIHDGLNRRWSEGCQVTSKDDLGIILAIAEKSAAIYGNSFTYTLF